MKYIDIDYVHTADGQLKIKPKGCDTTYIVDQSVTYNLAATTFKI